MDSGPALPSARDPPLVDLLVVRPFLPRWKRTSRPPWWCDPWIAWGNRRHRANFLPWKRVCDPGSGSNLRTQSCRQSVAPIQPRRGSSGTSEHARPSGRFLRPAVGEKTAAVPRSRPADPAAREGRRAGDRRRCPPADDGSTRDPCCRCASPRAPRGTPASAGRPVELEGVDRDPHLGIEVQVPQALATEIEDDLLTACRGTCGRTSRRPGERGRYRS